MTLAPLTEDEKAQALESLQGNKTDKFQDSAEYNCLHSLMVLSLCKDVPI